EKKLIFIQITVMNLTPFLSVSRIVFAISFLLTFSPSSIIAQMNISQAMTPTQYVNNVLLGEGVTATNVSFSGSLEQIGYMTNGGAFGIESGVVLSSDQASNPAGPCNAGFCTTCPNTVNDPDLLTVANSVPPLIGQAFSVSSVNDVCILEFDFQPSGDFVSFNYIFGSDEYLVWVNSQYNDIFAFFLSGPGITGPFSSPAGFPDGAVNIAQVPDTDPPLPITISSINDILNQEYYIDNPNAVDAPCINGYTVPFTASHPVSCGLTYHIKLAIADGSDTALESIVVLEEGSFGSPIPTAYEATASPECDPDPLDDVIIYCAWEDCGISTITISRPCLVPSVYPFAFDINVDPLSEASFNEDIVGLPESAVIPIGEYEIALSFTVPQDYIDEVTEELILNIVSGTTESSISVFIYDTPPLEAVTPEIVTVLCDEFETVCVDLIQDPLLEYPPVTYNWTINGIDFGTEECIEHTSLTTHLMEIYIRDGCDREMYLQTLFEVPYDPLEISMPNDTLLCNGANALLELELAGGQPPYQILWENFLDDDLAHTVAPPVGTTYEVTIIDNCDYMIAGSTRVDVETVEATIVRYEQGDDTYEFDVLTFPEEPFLGAFSFLWDFGDGGFGYEREVTHAYDGLDEYDAAVTVTTNNGCFDVATVHLYGSVILYIPSAFTPNNDGLNDAFEIVGRQIESFELFIYNRWGDVVYTSTSLEDAWMGNAYDGEYFAPDGMYQWVIRVQGYDVDAQELRGVVNLLR
ncbi:MAG: choice-of-anchor L domain-containing protein, partial [Flavobacteriales bacterium]